MAPETCAICGVRPATVRARVAINGQQETVNLCDIDYRRLARQQARASSPLESLFGETGNLFDSFFPDTFFGRRRARPFGAGGEMTDSDVIRTVLSQFNIKPDELRAQLEKEMPRAAAERPKNVTEIGVSPRLKDALTRALRTKSSRAPASGESSSTTPNAIENTRTA